MGGLELHLLGPVRVEVDGTPVAFDTRKATAVLARLAVEGPQRRDTLASLLWPESDGARARGALRRTLSVLRGGVGTAVAVDREQVRLEPGLVRCDVDRFHDETGRVRGHDRGPPCPSCVDALRDAVALHRGEFLSGFTLRDSPGFDDWQYLQTQTLRGQLTAALDLLVRTLAHHGDLEDAVTRAQQRLTLDPLHEPTHRRLMLLQSWMGHRGEAVRQYRACASTLERELGVPPLEETTSLYEQILTGTAPARPSARQLPGRDRARRVEEGGLNAPSARGVSSLPMVGRSGALAQLDRILRSAGEHGQLVVVEGEAGVGKSRLIAELAEQARREGGVAIVARCYPGEETLAYGPVADALRTMPRDAASTVARPWLSEAGRLVPELLDRGVDVPRPAPLGSREADRRFYEGVRQTLAAAGSSQRPALIVIEDLQWADVASQELITYMAHRLVGTPLCLTLTWRTEDVGGDHPLRRLLGQETATRLRLERLGHGDVAELARHAGVGDDRLVGRLFDETEGLPLFVAEYLAVLAVDPHGATWPVPAGVRDVLTQRLLGLSETARQVLTAAAVIGRSFDLDTLFHACGRSDEETVAALEELLAADVVTEMADATAPARYDFRHHALRTIVYDQASIARRRLLHARAAASLQRRGRSTEAAPVPFSVVAQHLRLAGHDAEAARLFARAGDEARVLAANAEAVEHYRAALALGHPDGRRLHEAIGDLASLLGDYRGALHSYQAAAEASDDPLDLPRFEQRIAGVHERRGDWIAAEAHLEAALAALPPGEAPALRARLQTELSLAAHRRGATDEARERAERSLQLAGTSGDALATAQAYNLLGIISRAEGGADVAVAHLAYSLELAESAADTTSTIAAMNNLALACADVGDVALALELAKTALARCRGQGDRHREAAILNNLADLLRAAGQEDEAMQHLKQAVAIFADIGEPETLEPEIWKLVDW